MHSEAHIETEVEAAFQHFVMRPNYTSIDPWALCRPDLTKRTSYSVSSVPDSDTFWLLFDVRIKGPGFYILRSFS